VLISAPSMSETFFNPLASAQPPHLLWIWSYLLKPLVLMVKTQNETLS